MKQTRFRALGTFTLLSLGSALLGASPSTANAGGTEAWSVEDYQGFDEGDGDATLITSLGEVRAGWATEKVDLDIDNSWSAIQDINDGTIYIGSDKKATVYRVHNSEVKPLAQIDDAVAIVSLALSGRTLYAGTMPKGQIWKIDTKTGSKTLLATLADVETVWSLAFDAKKKSLYAGTGPNGLLYRINPTTGKSNVAFDSEDKRIMSLVGTADGAIWLGTSDKALVFRHNPKSNRTRALADFSGNEVSALVEHRGTVIAAANDLAPATSSGLKSKEAVDKAEKKDDPGQEPDLPKEGTKPGADPKTETGSEPEIKKLRKGTGAVFRIQGDGHLTQLHALTSTYVTALAVTENGDILAGSADKGRIYSIDDDDGVATAIDIDQRSISQILVRKDKLAFISGDSTHLYRTKDGATTPKYTSEVFDTKTPSRFGRFVWQGLGDLRVQTRTGNLEEPGLGWSPWQAPSSTVRGSGNTQRGYVRSPPGRYFQYRVLFGKKQGTVLRRTTLYYLPANTPTRITSVSIEPAARKVDLLTLDTKPTKVRSPIIKLSWEIENADDDQTNYDLSVRREGDIHWRDIQTGNHKPLTANEFAWNTETYPDGVYRLRVIASDRLANTQSRTRNTTWTTPLFVVDNERPRIEGLTVAYPAVSARATDSMSDLKAMTYSIDDGPWRVGESQDGLFDDGTELLQIRIADKLEPGTHSISIRVADSAGNIGVTTTTFRVK